MSNVVPFPGGKKTVADVIQEISDRGCEDIVVLAYDKDDLTFFTGTIDDGAEVIWLLTMLQHKIMSQLT
jgi:hypothetical protein